MFETVELGRSLEKSGFDESALTLRQELLQLQFQLEQADFAVVIIVAGMEGAGKGALVHKLNEWMDPRLIETHAFWDHSDEEDQHPQFWRFWRAMPADGRIGILFGSWYTLPIINRALGKTSEQQLNTDLKGIAEFERMLSDDGTLIIKLWLHISSATALSQRKDSKVIEFADVSIPSSKSKFKSRYKEFMGLAESVIRTTDAPGSPWHLIEAEDPRYCQLTAGQIIRGAIQTHLNQPGHQDTGAATNILPNENQLTVLDSVDLSSTVSGADYKQELAELQLKLGELAWQARARKTSCVAVFEGWDAAGKGSAIRRVTQAIDPRLFRLLQYAAPSDEERSHHYLWRFWRQLERDGTSTLFDRSWYGRVLVERIEGFATQQQWQRSYSEINSFEEQLADHGSVVMKFWIHISPQEQLQRFELRQNTPHKQHKITEEDWRNRDQWDQYVTAVHDMVSKTSTDFAPWTLVAGNCKRYARLQILRTYCQRLEQALKE